MQRDLLRLTGFLKDRVLIGPKWVSVNLTNRCNFNCSYCTIYSKLKKKNKPEKKFYIDFDIFKNIITDCHFLRTERVMLLGKGEPFLHPQVYDMIEYVKEKRLLLSFCTNGSFDMKKNKVLRKVDDFNINFSAATEETFTKLQCGRRGAFYDIIDKIKILSRIRRVQGFPKVRIIYLVNKLNFSEVGDMIKIGKKYLVDFIEFRLMFATPEMSELILDQESIVKLRLILRNLMDQNDPFLQRTNLLFLYNIISNQKANKNAVNTDVPCADNYLIYYKRNFGERFQCCAGWFYLNIGIDGKVYTCCHYNDILTAGNIYQNSLKEIWAGKEYSRIRREMKYSVNIADEAWQKCHHCTRHTFLGKMLERAKDMSKTGLSVS